jgi:hypothetical protein
MDNQKGKKKWYYRWWAWCLWVVLIFSVVGALTGGSEHTASTGSAPEAAEAEAAAQAIKVTSTELSNAYKANEISADAKYKGKLVEITGTVDNIQKDIMDTAYVTFALGQYEIVHQVQCYFNRKNEGQLADISKGDRLTVRGTVDGGSLNVLVKNCQVVQ